MVLPAPFGPKQADRFAAPHVEAHALDHLASAEALLDAVHREEGFAALLRARRLAIVGRLAVAWLVGLRLVGLWLVGLRLAGLRLMALPRMVRLLVAALLVVVLLVILLRIILLLRIGLRIAALLVIVSVVWLRHVRRPRTLLGRQRPCCVLATGLLRFLWQSQSFPGQSGHRPAERPQIDAPEAGRRLLLALRLAAEEKVKHVCLGYQRLRRRGSATNAARRNGCSGWPAVRRLRA